MADNSTNESTPVLASWRQKLISLADLLFRTHFGLERRLRWLLSTAEQGALSFELAGTYTFFLALTPVGAFADGQAGPSDLLAAGAQTVTLDPQP
jgi:hypothetical protein